jgi:hypothetical protein
MAMLNNIMLSIRTVTFTQDSDSGTLTTLDLVDPRMLNDHSDYNVGNPTLPLPSRGGEPNIKPAQDPPLAH